MKMNRKSLIKLVLLLLLLPVMATAQVAASDEEKLSEQEKREMITFVERFVALMQKTRDVRPLLQDYFVPAADMSTFFTGSELGEPEEDGYKPNPVEGRRLAIVLTNMVYAYSLSQIIADEDYLFNLRSILPARLARSLDKGYDELIDSMEIKNGRRFRSLLPRVERYLKAAQRHLRRKNYERTAKYNRVIADRTKEDFYNFDIDAWSSCDADDKESLACWALRFGPDTRLYNVGTPYGLGPVIVRSKAGYRILFIFPHPMSG